MVTFPSARLLTILAVCCSIDARADLLASMRTRNYGSMNQLPSFYNMTDCRSTDALLFLYSLDPHLLFNTTLGNNVQLELKRTNTFGDFVVPHDKLINTVYAAILY